MFPRAHHVSYAWNPPYPKQPREPHAPPPRVGLISFGAQLVRRNSETYCAVLVEHPRDLIDSSVLVRDVDRGPTFTSARRNTLRHCALRILSLRVVGAC